MSHPNSIRYIDFHSNLNKLIEKIRISVLLIPISIEVWRDNRNNYVDEYYLRCTDEY